MLYRPRVNRGCWGNFVDVRELVKFFLAVRIMCVYITKQRPYGKAQVFRKGGPKIQAFAGMAMVPGTEFPVELPGFNAKVGCTDL
jgi:hypothetical protein